MSSPRSSKQGSPLVLRWKCTSRIQCKNINTYLHSDNNILIIPIFGKYNDNSNTIELYPVFFENSIWEGGGVEVDKLVANNLINVYSITYRVLNHITSI